MAIEKFSTRQEYEAAEKSTTESTVSLIEQGNEVKYDGINVLTKEPIIGDEVYLDDANKRHYIKRETYKRTLVPALWTHVGYVGARFGNKKLIFHKGEASNKYLAVSQFAWTDAVLDGEEHSKTIGLRFGLPDWGTTTSITFTYTATTLAEAAAACTAAIEAKLTELSATQATINEWWAYADTENNRVVVQRDNCTDYRFYNCTGLTHISWGDMPENSNSGFRASGGTADQRVMNNARAAIYYSTNGSTPTANVPLNATGTIAKESEFNDSAFCKLLRDTYGTYTEYIKQEYHVVYPQKLGAHGLPTGKELSEKYANKTAPTKSGGTTYCYPALHYGATIGFEGSADMGVGKWWLHGILEGCILMDDDNLSIIADAASKASASVPNNSTNRWFAQRCNAYHAWIFNGTGGALHNSYVNGSYACRAVTLVDD